MARDFWRQVLATHHDPNERLSTALSASLRESTLVLATCWQRGSLRRHSRRVSAQATPSFTQRQSVSLLSGHLLVQLPQERKVRIGARQQLQQFVFDEMRLTAAAGEPVELRELQSQP